MMLHPQSGGRKPSCGRLVAHLPANLTADRLAVLLRKSEWADYAAWFVGTVVSRRWRERGVDPSTFVPMATAFVVKHVPDRVRTPLLADLLKAGVLECDWTHHFGGELEGFGKCYCYRLGPSYRGQPLRQHPLTHPELTKKIALTREKERDAVTDPTHLALRDWLSLVGLTPDAEPALLSWEREAERRAAEHVQVVTAAKARAAARAVARGTPVEEAERRAEARNRVFDPTEKGRMALRELLTLERRFTVCKQGRIHTPISNLPGYVRQFIRVEGQREMMSLDIATSQPLLIGLMLEEKSEGRREGSGEGKGEQANSLRALYAHYKHDGQNKYLEDCLGGKLYDELAGKLGVERNDVKQPTLAVLYGRAKHMNTRVGLAFKELYPAVHKAVERMSLEEGVGALPRRMQRLESSLMIGGVAARLVREKPGMPLLTVHDSMVVPPEYAGYVEGVIADEWRGRFGLVPTVKRSSFTAPQEPRARKRPRGKRAAA